MRKTFSMIFEEIMNDQSKNLPSCFSLEEIAKISSSKYKWFGLHEILNEYVENKNLTPIPKKFFKDICQKIDMSSFQILAYTYDRIAEMLEEYDYEYVEDFKKNLLNGGKLFIISSKRISIDTMSIDEMNSIYNKLVTTFNEDEIEKIIFEAEKDVSGITSTLDDFDISKYKNIFIFINQNRIFRKSWTGTIEHELTHFIQRVVGFDKTLSRTKVVPGNGLGNYLNNKEFFDKIFGEVNDNALEFISYIIKEREQDTSMKRIATVFERAYENELDEENLPKKEALAQRENWLNKEILKLEESSFLDSDEWSKKQKIIKSDWTRLSDEEKELYDFAFAEIGFLLFEKFLKERQLKEELKLHFKTFAYGED